MLGKNYSTEMLISNESQALFFSPELKKKKKSYTTEMATVDATIP